MEQLGTEAKAQESWSKPIQFLHDEQEVDIGGGVQQSPVEVPAGHSLCAVLSVELVLIFQAGLTVIEVHFEEEPQDDKPEALILEHIYLPLGILCVGFMISLCCLITEIFIHRNTAAKQNQT